MLSIGSTQIKLLEILCNSMSVSGDEGEVRRIVLEEVKPYADEVKVDALGSVLVRKTGTGKKPLRVLLDAATVSSNSKPLAALTRVISLANR
jgi:putative aminopeptidase FrvX